MPIWRSQPKETYSRGSSVHQLRAYLPVRHRQETLEATWKQGNLITAPRDQLNHSEFESDFERFLDSTSSRVSGCWGRNSASSVVSSIKAKNGVATVLINPKPFTPASDTMEHADVGRLYPANATGIRLNQVSSKTNGSVNIAGVLDDNKLTVSLHSSGGPLLKRGNLLKRICHRLNNQDVRIIGHIPGHTHGRCEVLAGETNEGLKLVIESHRCFEDDPQGNSSAQKKFYRHALICGDLSHTNIVPFLGVHSSNQFPYACIFKAGGKENLKEYLGGNPGASRLKALAEVARGLHHIHDLGIVHGSIRAANIRIDDQGTAKIAGFASATLPNITSEDFDDSGRSDVSRWSSPEICHGNGLTEASDVYAFGMLAYEAFSGQVPFHGKVDTAVVIAVINGNERPPRPAHQELSDQLWGMIEKCWQKEPSDRPTIRELVAFLELEK
ncbi:kinase-like domain-containing protein [Thelephora terrestris]|uniref:Kinase-like domain-containing protein n=1 Tax=Thelephora terrestris TaxID=56493 RepID=A0A9P6L6H4_9AGAM|nr:kinase-like domain-containing protein [Thelephora terrestris]